MKLQICPNLANVLIRFRFFLLVGNQLIVLSICIYIFFSDIFCIYNSEKDLGETIAPTPYVLEKEPPYGIGMSRER